MKVLDEVSIPPLLYFAPIFHKVLNYRLLQLGLLIGSRRVQEQVSYLVEVAQKYVNYVQDIVAILLVII